MAKKKSRSKKGKSKNFLTQSTITTLVVTGFFTGMGTILGTVIAKYLLNEVNKTVPLPASLHSAIINSQ